jgi:hypothetical protein
MEMFHRHRNSIKNNVEQIFRKHSKRLSGSSVDRSDKKTHGNNGPIQDIKTEEERIIMNDLEQMDINIYDKKRNKTVSFKETIEICTDENHMDANTYSTTQNKAESFEEIHKENENDMLNIALQRNIRTSNPNMPPQWLLKHEKMMNEALIAARKNSTRAHHNDNGKDDKEANISIEKLRLSTIDAIPIQFHQHMYITRPPTMEEKQKYLCEYIPEFQKYRLLIFPALLPTGRKDVANLSSWLEDTVERYLQFILAQQLSHFKKQKEFKQHFTDNVSVTGKTHQCMEMVLDTLKTIYKLAEVEIARQVKLVCYERGCLLENVIENITMITAKLEKIRNTKLTNEMKRMKKYMGNKNDQTNNNFEELKFNINILLDGVNKIFHSLENLKATEAKKLLNSLNQVNNNNDVDNPSEILRQNDFDDDYLNNLSKSELIEIIKKGKRCGI